MLEAIPPEVLKLWNEQYEQEDGQEALQQGSAHLDCRLVEVPRNELEGDDGVEEDDDHS